MTAEADREIRSGPGGRGTAPFVIVSDLLPGSRPSRDAIIGVGGVPDDPITTALAAVAARRGGVWVGRSQDLAPTGFPVALRGLAPDAEDMDGYLQHAADTIWPLYHDLVRPAVHDLGWRDAYRRVNRAFAAAAAEEAAPGATVWVYDYHLHLVPAMLRRLRPDLRIGFYLSTMFPPADILRQTPMHRDMLAGLMGADVVGFQAAPAAENFLRLSQGLPVEVSPGAGPGGPGSVDVGVYPTSVDTRAIDRISRRPDVVRRAAAIRASVGSPPVAILSIDSDTEAAGVQRRLRAVRDLLSGGGLRPEDVVVVQVVTEGRPEPDPRSLVAQEVAGINGEFASVGRPCVHYVCDSPDLDERVALYLAADVLVATPLREGATLPALEFAAVGARDSSLVLSEFSGTALVLPEAFLVNPYDDDQLRRSLLAAIMAGPAERERRMSAMRTYVASYDTHSWARLFLIALHADAPALERTDASVSPRTEYHPLPNGRHRHAGAVARSRSGSTRPLA